MTRDQARGQLALKDLGKYVEPQSIFVGGGAKKLYALEEKRSVLLEALAKEWSKVADVDQKEYWTRAVPQVLHDMLDAYQTECGLIAAEAFLKRHGWTVTRPQSDI